MATDVLVSSDVATFVAAQTQEPLYYGEKWLGLIARTYGYRVVPLVARDAAGAVTGYLPVCVMSSPLTGRRVVALPFSDCCAALAADEATEAVLIGQARALAEREHARYLELRSGPSEAAAREGLAPSDLYMRWVVALATDSHEAWARLKSPVQRQIKKARKQGIQIRAATSPADMESYYQLHLLTRCRKHGMPAQPRRYFAGLWETFAADGTLRLLLAEHEGTVVAGMVFFASGTTLRYAYGASREEYLQLGPNNLLMWEAIEWGGRAGYTRLDLGRTARDNAGLMAFKRGWGSSEEPLTYYYYPRMAGLATTSERSWKYRMLTATWSRLPLPVAGALGGWLYPHLG